MLNGITKQILVLDNKTNKIEGVKIWNLLGSRDWRGGFSPSYRNAGFKCVCSIIKVFPKIVKTQVR